jgi:hypothetical protein
MGKRDVGESPRSQGATLLVYRPRLGPTGVTLAVQPTDPRSSGVPTPVDERRGSWTARRLDSKELVGDELNISHPRVVADLVQLRRGLQ